MNTLMKRAWEILAKNRAAYLALSMLYYGLILALMVYATFNLPLQNKMLETDKSSYMTGALSMLNKTGIDQQVFAVQGYGFLSNVLGNSYGGITLPSFFIPFVGILTGLYHAALLGIAFSPWNATIGPIILAHIPTLLIEGQATILAMLGAYIHGRAMIWPTSIGHTSRWKAYVEGIRQTGTIYMLIMPLFLISAIYGIIETAILIG